MKIKIWVIGVVLILTLGILINIIPMSSYYFSPEYQNAKYKGAIEPGKSSLEYKLTTGVFLEKNNTTGKYLNIYLRIIMNITIINKNNYSISYEVFKGYVTTSGMGYAKMINKAYIYVSKSNPIISILFPSGSNVTILDHTLTINNKGYHTFVNKFYGYPVFYPLSLYGGYVKYGKQYVAMYFGAGFNTSQIHKLLKDIYPEIENYSSDSQIMLMIHIIGGNSVPNQDWSGWFKYGFAHAFPLNIALIIGSFIIAIVYVRRGE